MTERNALAQDTMDYSIADITSPSQLQEVTLDQDATFSNTMGLRSPSGPTRGRSYKEVEEQLATLKKENFNLKLRIYFLEEKMGTNFTLDKDNIVKKNIELKVEIANLQKELQEKHDLLCQAVKAMELEDEDHKKYIQNKEEIVSQYQQELEDLRMQLQGTNFEADAISHKSDVTGYYSSRLSNFHESDSISELHEKIRMLEGELNSQKESNASLQLILDQAESFRVKCENLQKESQLKDEKIQKLSEEVNISNEKITNFSKQVIELESKLQLSNTEYQTLANKMKEETRLIDEMLSQMNELRKKYAGAKIELEREHKRAERSKMINDLKITELEEENNKQKVKIRQLQLELESAVGEVKKNQNLAVSTSLAPKPTTSNTDVASFSVSHPTTPNGTPQKNPLHVQITTSSSKSTPTIPTPSPLATDSFNLIGLEETLKGAGENSATREILSEIKALKNEHGWQKQKIVKLKAEQLKACEIIKSMIESRNKATEEIGQLKKQVEELEHELESVVSKPDGKLRDKENISLKKKVSEMNFTAANNPSDNEKSMAESKSEDNELIEQYIALTEELEAKIEVLVATLNEKDSQMQKIKAQYEEIVNNMEDKDNRIVDLEFELLSSHKDRSTSLEKPDLGSEKRESFYLHEIELKNKEIERISAELKKCKSYLQEIVNTELWEKNREIEKMHLKQVNTEEVLRLKKELSGKDLQLRVLKEKISELGIGVSADDVLVAKTASDVATLQEQLHNCEKEKRFFEKQVLELQNKLTTGANSSVLEVFKVENAQLQNDIRKSDALRLESNEVCSILSVRLEELALFLDSLLKQKSVLGFLGMHKNKKLREVIDNSLEFSRSFTMSMMINPDQSLAQLSNLTDLLNDSVFNELNQVTEDNPSNSVLSILPSNATLTYQSHLYRQSSNNQEPGQEQVIAALREQVLNLKYELKVRDNELNKLNNQNNREFNEKLTETELDLPKIATSVQLNKNLNTTTTTLKYLSDNQSESEAWSEPDRAVSKARIGLNYSAPLLGKATKLFFTDSTEEDSLDCLSSPSKRDSNRQSIAELHKQISDLEEELSRKNQEIVEVEEIGKNSGKLLKDLELKLALVEDTLGKAEAKRDAAENQVIVLQGVVDDLMSVKKHLEETLQDKDKEMQNKLNQLEVEKDDALKLAKTFEKEVCDAKNEVTAAKSQIATMREEMQRLESCLRQEYEQHTIAKLKGVEEEFVKRVKFIEEKAHNEIVDIEEKLAQMQEEYSKDYVKKCEVDEKIQEVECIIQELAEVKKTIKVYEETIQALKSSHEESSCKLQDSENKINQLRNNLDNTTLQYSEAVLEKTKLTNEKAILEQDLSKIGLKESQMRLQFDEIQTEFNAMKTNCQAQVSCLQKQKSKLEVKISELESSNAALRNKLIRLQVSRSSELNCSLPNIGSKNIQLFKRQFSENYSSEENVEDVRGFSFNRAQNVQPDLERHEANSSPDLGIESDHGRFSSLETQNTVPRPLLQTIELTESMSNLLDLEGNKVDAGSCGSDHCCQKFVQIAQENNDLKRKLSRLKRALEETANQLNLANQRKKQVEKTICKQIHKTSQVLRKAKANLDSGSDTDLFKS